MVISCFFMKIKKPAFGGQSGALIPAVSIVPYEIFPLFDEHISLAVCKELDHVQKSFLLHSMAYAIECFGGSPSQDIGRLW